jgi:hypothetical protein
MRAKCLRPQRDSNPRYCRERAHGEGLIAAVSRAWLVRAVQRIRPWTHGAGTHWLRALALLLASCASSHTPPDAAAPRDAGSPYCRVLERDCWCHLAGSRGYCFGTYGECATHERVTDADTEPCIEWMRIERDGGE